MAAVLTATLAAAAIAAIPAPPPRTAPDADPTIWVVNDHDTTIYLFGTFHALDGKSEWFNDEVATAFARSDELVLETIVPDLTPTPAEARPPSGIAVTSTGSFMAATRVAVAAGRSRGLNVAHGADMVLRDAAVAAGKPISGLERVEDQFRMFASLPAPSRGRSQAQQQSRVLGHTMALMQSAWNRGEQGILAALLKQMQATSPETYRIMFTDRNVHWAQWIAHRLETPGTVFVAVGSGHLVGQDCVQAKLAELGVKSARIN